MIHLHRFPDSHPLRIGQKKRSPAEKRKEDGCDQRRGKRLRKEDGEQQGIKVPEGARIETAKKDEEEKTFHRSGEKDKKELR